MIRDAQAARALLDQHGVVMLASHVTLPSLVTAIAGEHVRGSWWSHAHGKAIFNLASALEDYALVAKLVEGKVTFIAPRLKPALLAIVNDDAFRREKIAKLGEDARELLARVERGEVRGPDKKSREALERAMLVFAKQIHTAGGKHETVLSAWERPSELPLIADARTAFVAVLRGVRSAFS